MGSFNWVEPTETIWVPSAVAQAIFAVADQQDVLAKQREAAGRVAEAHKLFRPVVKDQGSSQ